MSAVLSIQSQVTYGHVGNSAAAFALQRLGHDVWPVPTVLFSNQPGHGGKRGSTVTPALMAELIAGVAERGWLARAGALLSGYLGAEDQAEGVLDALALVRRANRYALYACDPAFGDDPGGVYVPAGLVTAFRERLVPQADLVTPNAFELSVLTGRTISDAASAVAAARALGRPLVLCTSVPVGKKKIGTATVTPDEAWIVAAPRLSDTPHGTGDLMAALFLGHRLSGRKVPEALQAAASSVDALLRAAVEANLDEMPLIARQGEIIKPSRLLEVTAIPA